MVLLLFEVVGGDEEDRMLPFFAMWQKNPLHFSNVGIVHLGMSTLYCRMLENSPSP